MKLGLASGSVSAVGLTIGLSFINSGSRIYSGETERLNDRISKLSLLEDCR